VRYVKKEAGLRRRPNRLSSASALYHAVPFVWTREMKILADDPDWARDIYEARALALTDAR
jgi:hypothetical protein